MTTGRRDLAAFAADDVHDFLVRTVDPPSGNLPRRVTLLLDRGPYTVDGEAALMSEHSVDALVTKDSGDAMTTAKLIAARERGIGDHGRPAGAARKRERGRRSGGSS